MRSVEKEDLVKVMAYLTIPGVLGLVLGHPLGGFIVTYVSWRWIFFLNVPIAILGVILVPRFIPNYKEDASPSFDWTEFALSSLVLAGLMFSLEAASYSSLSLLLLLIVGGSTLLFYVRYARRVPNPILDLKLLKIPTFRVALVAGNLFRVNVGAVPFLLSIMLQVGFGLTAFASGPLTFVGAAGSVLMRMLAGGLLRYLGFRAALILDGLLCAVLLGTPCWRPALRFR